MKRKLLLAFLKHLHETAALSVPPEDLAVAVDLFAGGADVAGPEA